MKHRGRNRTVFALVIILCVFSVFCERSSPLPSSITISVPYELSSLDPHEKDTISNFAVLANFYEPLVRTGSHMELQPGLANSWENPDSYTWRFHLRENARFHSGKSFTAEDVVSTFDRLAQDPALEMRSYITNVAEVKARGKDVVEIRLQKPSGVFLNKLNFILIVPSLARYASLAQKVDGTGAYRFVEWTKGESIRMEANRGYWSGARPLNDAIFLLNRSPEEALRDFESERSQLVQCNLRSVERIFAVKKNYERLRQGAPYVKYLSYDLTRDKTPHCDSETNPFKKKEVRQVLHLGIDRDQLVEDLPTFAVPNPHPVPPLVFGYPPGIGRVQKNLAKARELMKKAGFAEGFRVALHSRRILQETAFLIQKQLYELGITVDVQLLPDEEWFQVARRKDISFFLSRFGCPTGDASDFLEMAVHTSNESRHYGGRNYAGYSNVEIDRMIEEAAGVGSLQKRAALLRQVLTAVDQELIWIPLYIDEEVYALHKDFEWKPRNDSYIFVAEIKPRKQNTK